MPKFWRPPYGDSDNRVRAIAKEVRIFYLSCFFDIDRIISRSSDLQPSSGTESESSTPL